MCSEKIINIKVGVSLSPRLYSTLSLSLSSHIVYFISVRIHVLTLNIFVGAIIVKHEIKIMVKNRVRML